jgi:hypothetical protein
MTSSPSLGLVKGLVFKVMLAVMALCSFVIASPQAYARLQLSIDGVPATIQRVSATTPAPTSWSEYQGASRALFPVRIATSKGRTLATNLFLPEATIRNLLAGRTAHITIVWDDPHRFLLDGEPLPSYGAGWILLGLLFGATFLYALHLR